MIKTPIPSPVKRPRNVFLRRAAPVVLSFALLAAACKKDELEVQPVGSLGEQIVGEWALVRSSGGIVGGSQMYELASSPDVIQFRSDQDYIRFRSSDTSSGAYWLRDVARIKDTISFHFGLRSEAEFGTRRYRIIDGNVLETVQECCDQIDLVYHRRP